MSRKNVLIALDDCSTRQLEAVCSVCSLNVVAGHERCEGKLLWLGSRNLKVLIEITNENWLNSFGEQTQRKHFHSSDSFLFTKIDTSVLLWRNMKYCFHTLLLLKLLHASEASRGETRIIYHFLNNR